MLASSVLLSCLGLALTADGAPTPNTSSTYPTKPPSNSNEQMFIDAANIVNIQQTVNLFPILVDSYRYTEMNQVFTESATATISSDGSTASGLPAIEKLVSDLKGHPGQHALTTQYVKLHSPTTASSVADLQTKYFGQGANKGQIFTVFGIYYSDLVLTNAGWRITDIRLSYTAVHGNETIGEP